MEEYDTPLAHRTLSPVKCQPEPVEGGIRMRMSFLRQAQDNIKSLKFVKTRHEKWASLLCLHFRMQ